MTPAQEGLLRRSKLGVGQGTRSMQGGELLQLSHGVRSRWLRRSSLDWIVVCTKLRATGMPIKTIRRHAQLVSAGHGNEQERLALMEAHRADVTGKVAELQETSKLINHKIDVYRGRVAAEDSNQLWAPNHP
jgi:hypothetical protein